MAGRSNRLPDRVLAYTVNIGGSVAGICVFALFSWLQLSPVWWFGCIALGIAYYLRRESGRLSIARGVILALVVIVAGVHAEFVVERPGWQVFWSPYYRVDYRAETHDISVNLIGHQAMVSRDTPRAAYSLPYLFERDSGGQPPTDVLIIGAGSGNDLSRALQWGAEHIDAVEIDPVIQRLGVRDHPDHPYDDPRVTVHIDDGRNFLRSTTKQYDLVVYALVDSLVLHSSYSNLRLESYLFTEQAFRDVKQRLKPGGRFVIYNYFRQAWLVHRLQTTLAHVFGSAPLVLPLPYRPIIDAETMIYYDFTMFIAGDTARLSEAFAKHGSYWVRMDQPVSPSSPNGFTTPTVEERKDLSDSTTAKTKDQWGQFGPAEVAVPAGEPLRTATDDWPFLYLRQPQVPVQNLRGLAIMAAISLLLLALFRPRKVQASPGVWRLDLRMFFLGAGFMLVETRAVVQMALLFGSTWMVNSVVFFAVLVMILLANLFVLRFRPRRLEVYYLGLLLALVANVLLPLDAFLGMDRTVQVVASSLLVFSPAAFAAVIFAVSFGQAASPDRAIAANVAGAMLGGLAEYGSMVLGFQYLMLVAVVFYLVAVAMRLPQPVANPEAS